MTIIKPDEGISANTDEPNVIKFDIQPDSSIELLDSG